MRQLQNTGTPLCNIKKEKGNMLGFFSYNKVQAHHFHEQINKVHDGSKLRNNVAQKTAFIISQKCFFFSSKSRSLSQINIH